ncbi:hypothetical protein B0I35DRAFT_501481 [Stachybotrys elegans]|uniref:Rhodopsin domain-containing protein n=1 Tax=Stachybotrys elegans TaxID=80388 RepID=A0A8K0STI0_9HYPO|nr:hypothetical protein B0I35DRAFT_501481 [Stachybotrys elegans]
MPQPADLGTAIIVVSVVLTVVSAVFLGLRLFCKVIRHRHLWWDDYILIASWICLLVATGISIYDVELGLGKDISEVDPRNVPQIALVGTIYGIFAVWGQHGAKPHSP